MPPMRAGATSTALTIELRHRGLDPFAKRDLRRFGGAGERRLGCRALVRVERSEDVRDEIADLAERIGRRDAHTKTWEVFADRGHDRAHPVVRAGPTLLTEADLAEREADLVEYDEEIRTLAAVTAEQPADRAPGIVHEGLRPRDPAAAAVERAFAAPPRGRPP